LLRQVGGDIGRVNSFLQVVAVCPYEHVAVVSYWGFISLVTEKFASVGAISLDNAQWIRAVWEPPQIKPKA
jgi:hypothetical protein